MTRYLISSPHNADQCVRTLDELLAKGPSVLEKFVFGCSEEDHMGYAIVEAKKMSDALAFVPDFLQECACITKVDRYTPADIKALHAKVA